jgi:hypothetical protein
MSETTPPDDFPHDLEAEKATLGAILVSPERFSDVAAILQPTDFYRHGHRVVFTAMGALVNRGDAVDVVTVRAELARAGQLEESDPVYICALCDGVPRSTNAAYYAQLVREKAITRAAIQECRQTIATVQQNPGALGNGLPAHHREAWDRIVARATAADTARSSLFRTAKAIGQTAERVDWMIRGFLARGAITELTGKPKLAGKTTLNMHMVACLLDGDYCLGDMAAKSPVVYLTEQTHATLREPLRRAHLLDREDLSILSYWDVKGVSWPAIAEMAGREAERIGAHVLMVDTLSQFAGIKGDGENNSGDALAALAPLQGLAHRGLAILVDRHARKSGGEVGEDGRGSSAFTGGVDIVLSLKRPEGNHKKTLRVIEGLSRYDETPARLVIEKVPVSAFCPHRGIDVWAESFRVIGDVDAAATDEATDALEHHLPTSEPDAKSMADLVELTGATRAAVQRAMKTLPGVQTTGEGKKHNPLRYFRPEIVSAQTSISRFAGEQNESRGAQ